MNRMQLLANRYLINTYLYRFKSVGIVLDEDKLIEKLENLDEQILTNTLKNMLSNDKDKMLEAIKSLNVGAYLVNKNDDIDKLKGDAMKKLNLSDISEFQNDGKKYYKFRDKNGDIAITRNLNGNARDLFLDILNSDTFIDRNDGKSNAEDIFKVLKKRKLIEVKLKNSTDIENEQSKRTKAIIREFQKHFPNKTIEYSIEEQLFIVKNNDDEIVLAINNENGILKIKQLNQSKYENNDKASKEKKEDNLNIDEIIIELENDDEINNIIKVGIDNNVNEEVLTSQVKNIVTKKYPRFINNSSLALIVASLISNAKNSGRNNSNNLARGKAYTLTNGKNLFSTNDNDQIAA